MDESTGKRKFDLIPFMECLPEIIGIAGTNGAGKDSLADLRLKRNNARKVSLSDILRIEATKRGLSHERVILSSISAEMNAKLGAGALSMLTIQNFRMTRDSTEHGLSIVSVRRSSEARIIQKEEGVVLWVDADRGVRYSRILKAKRGRVDDLVSFDEFCEQEDREMTASSDDPHGLNMSEVRDLADIHIDNNFSSEDHYEQYLIERFGL